MTYRFARPLAGLVVLLGAGIVGLGAATAAPASSHGAPQVRPTPRPDVEILVGGLVQPRHVHAGRLYVEALEGREYAIHLRNPSPLRVAVALSVDGLNTIDARESTAAAARKWVIDAFGSLTIRGWQTSRSEARRFLFTSEARSYGQALGRTANLGLITAVFFSERTPRVAAETAPDGNAAGLARGVPPPAPPAVPPADATAGAAAVPAPAAETAARAQVDAFAATGMGHRTVHRVTEVSLELEDTPVRTVNLRYEFRPQLVRLGVLPGPHGVDPLTRRDAAQGFEPGFSPIPGPR